MIPRIKAIIKKAYDGRLTMGAEGASILCEGGGVEDTVSDIATFLKRTSCS